MLKVTLFLKNYKENDISYQFIGEFKRYWFSKTPTTVNLTYHKPIFLDNSNIAKDKLVKLPAHYSLFINCEEGSLSTDLSELLNTFKKKYKKELILDPKLKKTQIKIYELLEKDWN